jgi:gliding motility-associated-like protein
MKKVFLPLIVAFFGIAELNAQCNDPAPPSLTCAEAGEPDNVLCTLDGYCSTSNQDPNTQNVPPGFCGSVENNVWLAFVAGSTELQIGIDIETCNNGDGLQAQIYADCQGYAPVSNCWNPATQTDGVLTATNLTIGNTYYLMIDGWAGDFCDFALTEISGSTSPPEPEDVTAISGPNPVCPGAIVSYCAPPAFGASIYNWEIPADATILAGQGTSCITVDWGDSAGGDVCVTAANSCNSAEPFCINVIMGPPPSSTIDAEVCQEDLPYIFDGAPLDAPGQYSATYVNQLGCDSTVTLNLEVFYPTPTTVTATICDGDTYPFGGATFSQTGTYPLTFQTAQGCDSMSTLELTVLQAEAIIATPAPITCLIPTVTLDGTLSTFGPGVSYLWTTTDGFICSDPTAPVTAACAGGTYELTVTNSQNGVECTSTATIVVEEDFNPPTVEAGPPMAITCAEDCVVLEGEYQDAGNNVIVQWLGPNGFSSSNLNPTVCVPGEYNLTIISLDNGCSANDMVTVEDDVELPEAEAGASLTLDCANPSVLADGTSSSQGPDFSYDWVAPNGSSVSDSITAVINAPGEYTLIVTNNANGCSNTDSVQINLDNTLPVANAGADATINCFSPSVMLNGNASTNNGNTVFDWQLAGNSVGNAVSISVDVPGTYALVVTDTTNGCSSSDQVFVDENIAFPTAVANASGPIDCITGSVTLDATGSLSQSGNIGYIWEQLPNVQLGSGFSVNVGDPGFYLLTVTDLDNGCEAQDTIEVLVDQNTPVSNPGPAGTLTCTTTDWTIGPGTSSTGPSILYQWEDASGGLLSNDTSITVDIPGDYTLIVTNTDNGCTAEQVVLIAQDIDDPLADAGTPQTLTCSATNLLLDGTASSNGTDFSYQWTDTAGNPVGDSIVVEVNDPDIYTLLVTDETNGCTAIADVEISQDVATPLAVGGDDETLTCLTTFINLDASNSQGPNLQFEWLDGSGTVISNDPDVSVAQPDTFTLIVTNQDNGCTDEDEVVIDENTILPTAAAGADDILNCSVTELTLDASTSSGNGPLEYQWENGGVAIGSNATLDISSPGTYTLIVTDIENGCTSQDDVLIDQDIVAPTSVAGPTGTLTCTSASVQLDGAGSSTGPEYTYEWINAGGVPVGNNLQVDVTETGTYTLVVTNTTNGCTDASQTQVVPDSDLPTAAASASDILTCDVLSIDISAVGSTTGPDITYSWQDPAAGNLGNGNTISVDAPGVYTLTVENTTNGCSSSATVAVNQDITPPDVDPGAASILTCSDPVVLLDGGGTSGGSNLTFEWFDPADNSISSTDTISVFDPGFYTLEVLNLDNGCSAADSVEVLQDAGIPTVNPGLDAIITCTDPVITLDGTGSETGSDIEYQWSTSAGDPVGSDLTLDVTSPDTYSLLVTNTTNGCTATASVLVEEDTELPIADAGLQDTLTCSVIDIQIGGAATSAGLEFVYDWTNDAGNSVGSTANLSVSIPDTYTLLVTDTINGCTASAQVAIDQDILTPTADAGTDGLLTCADPIYTIGGNASSSGPEFNYLWSDTSGTAVGGTPTLDVNVAGTYTLLITNTDNGCTTTDEVLVEPNNELPSLSAAVSDTLTCVVTASTIDASASVSATGFPLDYAWEDPAGQPAGASDMLTVGEPGAYSLVITDTNNGCTAEAMIPVEQNIVDPVAEAGMPATLNCDILSVDLDGSSSQGTALQFEWLDSNGAPLGSDVQLTVSAPDTYELMVTDGVNGCTATDQVSIDQDIDVPVAEAMTDGLLTCAITSVALDGSASSQGAEFTYSWTDSQGTDVGGVDVLDVQVPDTYTLEVEDTSNGCTNTTTVVVTIDTVAPVPDAGTATLLTCDVTEALLDGSASNTLGTPDFEWQDAGGTPLGTTAQLSVDQPGVYTLIVTDLDNGCVSTADLTIQQDVQPPLAVIEEPDTLDCAALQVPLSSTGSSSGTDFAYQWLNDLGVPQGSTPSLDVSEPGIYTLIVTNTFNGCSTETTTEVLQDDEVPTPVAIVSDILTCAITEVELDAGQSAGGPNLAFEWLLNGNPVSNDENTSVDQPGNYQLIVVDTDNNCTAATSIQVEQNIEVPAIAADVSGIITCTTDAVTLDSDGSSSGNAIDYAWINAGGTVFSIDPSVDVSIPGDYTLVVLDTENGCADTTQVNVAQDVDLPSAAASVNATLTCVTTEVTLDNTGSSTGGFSYTWLAPDGQTVIGTGSSVDVDEPGQYLIVVTEDFNGCSSQASVQVDQDIEEPEAIIDLSAEFLITCDDPQVPLDGSLSQPSGLLAYEWTFQNNVIASTDAAAAGQPGQYTLLVTNTQNGCTDETSITVDQDTDLPQVIISAPELITCIVESVELDGTASSSGTEFEYLWDGPNILSGTNDPSAEAGTTGSYSLTVTNLTTGCSNSAFVNVQDDITPPDAEAEAVAPIDCFDPETTISGTGSSVGGIYTYEWSTQDGQIISGANSLEAVVAAAGEYALVVTNLENGCSAEAVTLVEAFTDAPVGADINIIDPSCFESQDGSITVSGIIGGSEPYVVSLNDAPFITGSQTFGSLIAGTYDIIVQDVNGCEWSTSVLVEQADELLVDLGDDILINLGESVEIEAEVNRLDEALGSIEWQYPEDKFCDTLVGLDCRTVLDTPLQTTIYAITVVDDKGCRATDQIRVRVNEPKRVYVPSAFSPDGDGRNDFLTVYGGEDVQSVHQFLILNRWGEIVHQADDFSPNDPNAAWDGTFKGEEMNPAVYVYFVEVEFIDGTVEIFKGDVTLVR